MSIKSNDYYTKKKPKRHCEWEYILCLILFGFVAKRSKSITQNEMSFVQLGRKVVKTKFGIFYSQKNETPKGCFSRFSHRVFSRPSDRSAKDVEAITSRLRRVDTLNRLPNNMLQQLAFVGYYEDLERGVMRECDSFRFDVQPIFPGGGL